MSTAESALGSRVRAVRAERRQPSIERRAAVPLEPLEALRVLHGALGVPVAPHVAALLVRDLAGSHVAVVETARLLSPAQLAGSSLLPDPLPVAPVVRRMFTGAFDALDRGERQALLIASVSVSQRTDAFLGAAGTDIDSLVASPLVEHLSLVAGHVQVASRLVRAVVHDAASVGERTSAHRALAAVHAADGDEDVATWHVALSSLAGSPALAARLIGLSRRMIDRGEAVWAQRVAREAAAHATGRARGEALAVAGLAALHAGHVEDAADLLREAARALGPAEAGRLLAPLVFALTFVGGQVPDELMGRDASPSATLVAAGLHAERADADAASRLLDAAGGPVADRGAVSALALAWTRLASGDPAAALDALGTCGAHLENVSALTRACRALALAALDEVDEARGLLASVIADLAPTCPGAGAWQGLEGQSPFAAPEAPVVRTSGGAPVGSSETRSALTPLTEAYVRLTSVLVETWAGEVDGARAALEQAALRLPVALPFAGAGAVIAGRLGLSAGGAPGIVAESLERLLPLPVAPPVRAGLLANRALALSLAGDDAAAAHLHVLAEEQRSSVATSLPGLSATEAAAFAGASGVADVSTPGVVVSTPRGDAQAARARIAVGPDGELEARIDTAVELSREVRSALERAWTRLVAGRVLRASGRHLAAEEHLRAAGALFVESGASALADLARGLAPSSHAAPSGADQGPGDLEAAALAAEESRWDASLTVREAEVARLVGAGASNRDVSEALVISVRTVEVHLSRVFRKLGLGSRVELALLIGRGAT